MASPFIQTLILVLGVVSTLGCPEASKEAANSVNTPTQQLTLEGVRIEERRSGKILWQGVGSDARGDFERSTVNNLELTRPPQKHGEVPITIHSPSAKLNLGEGSADFSDAVITDTTGRKLNAGHAHYSEKTSSIKTSGPMTFTATSLKVEGTTSMVQLGTGEVTITGPVHGVFTPQTPQRPSPHTFQ